MKVQFNPQNLDMALYHDLTVDNIYQVIGLEADDLRLINDEGLPYLYPQDLFFIIDSHEPEDWVNESGDKNERYAYPPELNRPGFFEDYFDNDPKTVAIFRQYLAKQRLLRAEPAKAT